jgi:hypothetical protein
MAAQLMVIVVDVVQYLLARMFYLELMHELCEVVALQAREDSHAILSQLKLLCKLACVQDFKVC